MVMSINNGKDWNQNSNFDEKHRFIKGHTASKGKRKRTQTDKLLAALKKVGKNINKDFWDVVAAKAFIDKEIMKAVINKLVPTLNELTGEGGSPLNVILQRIRYSPTEGENKETTKE